METSKGKGDTKTQPMEAKRVDTATSDPAKTTATTTTTTKSAGGSASISPTKAENKGTGTAAAAASKTSKDETKKNHSTPSSTTASSSETTKSKQELATKSKAANGSISGAASAAAAADTKPASSTTSKIEALSEETSKVGAVQNDAMEVDTGSDAEGNKKQALESPAAAAAVSSNATGTSGTSTDKTDSNKKRKRENEKSDDVEMTNINNNEENDDDDENNGDKVDESNGIENSNNNEKKAKKIANPYDAIKWIVVKNDGKPDSLIKLVGLKSLFAKQLPKMPRAYIARLVFDRRHISLAILSDDPAVKDSDEEIIGGICFRPFYDMRFAEIAFCAVSATHQVKGYGTRLMNLVKQLGAQTGIEYFITYADNYAIGYFKKQGFTKNIQMPKGRYYGLIKDYDGGTMMECYVHPSIDFTRVKQMLQAQRKFILDRVRLKANSHKVYDPLPKDYFLNNNANSLSSDLGTGSVPRAHLAAARAMSIPGLVEAGWTMADLLASTGQGGKDSDRQKSALKSELLSIIRKIEEQQFAWPFREPVDTNEVHDYLDVIKEPIDLSTIEKRIRKGDHYKSKKMLYFDLMLMVNNCKLYNEEASTYVHCAIGLEKFLGSVFSDVI